MRSRASTRESVTEDAPPDTDVLAQRILAQVVDWIAMTVLVYAVAFFLVVAGVTDILSRGVLQLLLVGVAIVGYNIYYEAYRDGQTIGKRMFDIRVLDKSGGAISLRQAAIRNVPAVASGYLIAYLIALLMIVSDERNRRVFDILAGTIVAESE